ncbi:MAG: hypothetical protein E2590_08660 [Chryseobacterium sp.]|nr:hypothetical protein [Chryseobacterium sp.]
MIFLEIGSFGFVKIILRMILLVAVFKQKGRKVFYHYRDYLSFARAFCSLIFLLLTDLADYVDFIFELICFEGKIF